MNQAARPHPSKLSTLSLICSKAGPACWPYREQQPQYLMVVSRAYASVGGLVPDGAPSRPPTALRSISCGTRQLIFSVPLSSPFLPLGIDSRLTYNCWCKGRDFTPQRAARMKRRTHAAMLAREQTQQAKAIALEKQAREQLAQEIDQKQSDWQTAL